MLAKIALFLLLASPLAAQTVVPIVNPSFEQGFVAAGNAVGAGGAYSLQSPTGWTRLPTSSNSGLWQPDTSTCGYKTVPDGSTVWWSNGATITQDLKQPALPLTIYTVTVYVGHRNCFPTSTYTISLLAGSTVLCSWTGTNAAIPLGSFAAEVNACTTVAPSGDLTVSLSSGGEEVDFDDVSISYVATVPTDALTFGTTPTCSGIVAYDDGSNLFGQTTMPFSVLQLQGAAWVNIGTPQIAPNGLISGSVAVNPNFTDSSGNVEIEATITGLTGLPQLGPVIFDPRTFTQGETGICASVTIFKATTTPKAFQFVLTP
jgi:hypothetical protein